MKIIYLIVFSSLFSVLIRAQDHSVNDSIANDIDTTIAAVTPYINENKISF
ncbi:MAG: hypothetical protein ABJA71_17490 [Ginsengibacter sp.]